MKMSTLQSTATDMSCLIENALNRLCIPPRLLGYTYLTYVINQVAMNPLRVKGLTKELYPEAARLYGTNAKAVEHNVRTAIIACWTRGGKETLDRMAQHHLIQRPWATEFIAIVAQYIKHRSLQQPFGRPEPQSLAGFSYFNTPAVLNQYCIYPNLIPSG